MTVNLPSIAASAAFIGLVQVIACTALGEAALAQGIAVSAVVMLVNLGLWALSVRRLIVSAVDGSGGAAPAFFIATKLVGMAFMVWGLVQVFPTLSVLLGGSVVVLSILLHAAVLAFGQLTAVSEA